MSVTQNLGALGSWTLNLAADAPVSVLSQLGYFGHVAIWRGLVDVTATADADLLRSARYVGVLREKVNTGRIISGSGMLLWLGDEDHKGAVLENKVVLTNASLGACLDAVLPASVTLGTVHDPGGTYTGSHQWQTPRDALDIITTAFGVEYRVNGDGTLDVGTAAQLYNTANPVSVISARGAGRDMDLEAIGGTFTPDVTAIDYSTRVVLIGQSTDSAGSSTQFAEGSADAPSVPYKDLHGNTVRMTRMISDSGQTTGSVAAAAQLQLNRFNRTAQILKCTATDYEMSANFVVGDACWVYDPDNGITDPANEVTFRGEVIHPQSIRVVGITWPVTEGHTVAFRTQDGVWMDLTRFVTWETGSNEVTVGDLPKTLTSSSNPVQDRAQAAADSSTPNAPTGLTLSTASTQDAKGKSTATLTASWTAPTQNTDGSVITDLDYCLVQYRWHGRAPLWDTRIAPTTTIDIPGLSVGLVYDVQVSAVDTAGHVSAPTAVAQITAAADTTAPNPPSDPVVGSYLGQLKITWDGKDNTGAAMPPDFAVVEVHVSATSGFTPDSSPGSATLVSQLSTAGVAYATAPYGATRYVKLVAVDNSGNHSAPSGQASGATVQAGDGDIAALSVGKLTAGTMSADVVVGGRFATALTGGRVEMNSLGFQKFASDGVTKLVSITGTEALMTGVYKTASTGRRIEMGSGGTTGLIDFIAPDGTVAFINARTESTGIEAIQFGLGDGSGNILSPNSLWNRINYNNDGPGWANYRANRHEFHIGGTNSASGSDSSRPGFFEILETSDYGGHGTVRLIIDSTGFHFADPSGQERLAIDGGGLAYWEAGGVNRLYLPDGVGNGYGYWHGNAADIQMRYVYGSGEWDLSFGQNGGDVQFENNFGNFGSSPSITHYTPGGFGGRQHVWNDSTNGTWFEFHDWSYSSWMGLRAAAFQVNSDKRRKSDVKDFTGPAMRLVKSAKVKSYRRKDHMRGPSKEVIDPKTGAYRFVDGGGHRDGPVEIGLIAQEAPAQIVGARGEGPDPEMGVDLYQMASLLWAALHEVDDRLAVLETKGKP